MVEQQFSSTTGHGGFPAEHLIFDRGLPGSGGTAGLGPGGNRRGRLVVLEGLSAVGKSTLAPLLARAVPARFLPTVPPEFEDARHRVDNPGSLMARLHFWMMANYAAAQAIRLALRAGGDVVVESYFYRTLATHAAMGVTTLPVVDWDYAVTPDLAVLLTVDEEVRQRRLAARPPDSRSYWSRLEEANVETIRRTYDTFGLMRIDTTGLTVTQVVRRLRELLAATPGPRI
ncbi:MAG TPA: AAA family ATPase [Planosporangium sp.]|nr:AAA family ATPase [Planosporangium sp.]